jgi:hypothetical protein
LQVIAMKRIGLLIGFLTVLVFLLPLTAQDAKDAKKDAAKKEVDKKDDAKKDEKKTTEKLVYGGKFRTKIHGIKGETNREYSIEIQEVDPNKVADVQRWSLTRQQQLSQQYANAIKQKDGGAALRNWMRDSNNYQIELSKKNVYTTKNMDVRAADNAKVRTMIPPIEFDDAGFQKKWTKKELDALRDKTPLLLYEGEKRIGLAPGFATDFDAIKQGQYVDIYMPKAAKKDEKKKKTDDDPPPAKDRPEFLLIVILPDTGGK